MLEKNAKLHAVRYTFSDGTRATVRHHCGQQYWYRIRLADGRRCEGTDLRCGAMGATLFEMLGTLCSFMAGCGESINYSFRTGREGENCDLFAEPIAQWCAEHEDDLSFVSFLIEEHHADREVC